MLLAEVKQITTRTTCSSNRHTADTLAVSYVVRFTHCLLGQRIYLRNPIRVTAVMTALLVDHPYIFLRNPTNKPTYQMIQTTNRNLWAEEPHHRPTQQELVNAARKNNYLPDPSIPLHQQSLLSVTPPTPEQKAEADWELSEEDIVLAIEAQRAAASKLSQDTFKKLEQDRWDRYYEEHGYPEQPIRSQSQERMRRMIG